MSCTGCESIIEETLQALDGIIEAKASFSKNQVSVVYDSEKISFEQMLAAVKKAGYRFEKSKQNAEAKANNPLTTVQFIGIAVIILAIYLIINHTIGFNFIPEVTSSMGYGVLFVVGLLTSLHCVAMCGGINLSQCMNRGEVSSSNSRIKPSLLYNLGRVTSYTVIGGIIGAVGSVISFSGWAKGLIAILTGLFMILMGLSMTGLFPRLNQITPRLPRIFRETKEKTSRGKGPYIVGLLNGLMPCGPLQAMQIYALGTGSMVAGALSMFFFSLGTLPLMFGLGAFITLLGSKFTKQMMKVSAMLVVLLGAIMLGRGFLLSGVTMPSFATSASSNVSATAALSPESGVQTITSTLTSRGYPSITVQKGMPVVWNLQADKRAINGCNRQILISEYNTQINLKPGDNTIRFTPTETGTFTYSCWMGMITGQIKVVEDLNGQSAQVASDEATKSQPIAPSSGMPCCIP